MDYYVAASEKNGKKRSFCQAREFTPRKGRLVPKQHTLSDDPSERFRVIEVYEEGSRIADIIEAVNCFEQASDLPPGCTGIWDAFQKFADDLLNMPRQRAKKAR